MKKRIAILGSTGSIGENTLKIIKKDKKNFEVVLLSTNKNINKVFKQAKEYKVKNVIISDPKFFQNARLKFKNSKIKIFNNFNNFNKIFKKKNDLIMSSITGMGGLEPTLKSIRFTKRILVANKEAIICGWILIKKELKKHKTKFIPIDSEHFSIWSLIKNDNHLISKIYLTASGGPFLNTSKKKLNYADVKNVINHPNWSMGKKISTDSATMMNKVFEVIEAKNIFNIPYKKISILTHPNSYIHAIVKFNNGLTKILAHEPDMKIPIFNSLNDNKFKSIKSKSINIRILNNLNLKKVDSEKFSFVKILKFMPNYNSLYETILITINDYLVYKFLKKKISFEKMVYLINKLVNSNKFTKYKKIKPKNVKEIYRLRDYVSSKMNSLGI